MVTCFIAWLNILKCILAYILLFFLVSSWWLIFNINNCMRAYFHTWQLYCIKKIINNHDISCRNCKTHNYNLFLYIFICNGDFVLQRACILRFILHIIIRPHSRMHYLRIVPTTSHVRLNSPLFFSLRICISYFSPLFVTIDLL